MKTFDAIHENFKKSREFSIIKKVIDMEAKALEITINTDVPDEDIDGAHLILAFDVDARKDRKLKRRDNVKYFAKDDFKVFMLQAFDFSQTLPAIILAAIQTKTPHFSIQDMSALWLTEALMEDFNAPVAQMIEALNKKAEYLEAYRAQIAIAA